MESFVDAFGTTVTQHPDGTTTFRDAHGYGRTKDINGNTIRETGPGRDYTARYDGNRLVYYKTITGERRDTSEVWYEFDEKHRVTLVKKHSNGVQEYKETKEYDPRGNVVGYTKQSRINDPTNEYTYEHVIINGTKWVMDDFTPLLAAAGYEHVRSKN